MVLIHHMGWCFSAHPRRTRDHPGIRARPGNTRHPAHASTPHQAERILHLTPFGGGRQGPTRGGGGSHVLLSSRWSSNAMTSAQVTPGGGGTLLTRRDRYVTSLARKCGGCSRHIVPLKLSRCHKGWYGIVIINRSESGGALKNQPFPAHQEGSRGKGGDTVGAT